MNDQPCGCQGDHESKPCGCWKKWLWLGLAVAVAAGIGYYFWQKRTEA